MLNVYYDPECGFCEFCAATLARQPQLIGLRFVSARSAEARRTGRSTAALLAELTVEDPRGHLWIGPAGFLMCLFALARTRPLAELLSADWLWPLAARFFDWVSAHRPLLSRLPFVPERCTHACAGPACALPSPYR